MLGRRVEQDADVPARVAEAPIRDTADGGGAGGGRGQAADHAHGGGLAGPVRAQKAGHRAGLTRERHVVHRGMFPVTLAEMFDRDHASQRAGNGWRRASAKSRWTTDLGYPHYRLWSLPARTPPAVPSSASRGQRPERFLSRTLRLTQDTKHIPARQFAEVPR